MKTPTYTLLIVEDFPADRELYRRALLEDSNCNYCLLEAESVAEGLELCRRQKIDAILLDYMLPDADGLEFLAQLSARSSEPPPVVMMTGQGSESIAVRAIKLGAQDYLVKRDLTPELLQLTMRKAIDNNRLRLQLQQVEDRFQMSIDNMSDCVGLYSVMRDEAGQIIDFRFDYLNPAALDSNRMSSDDIGKSLCEMFPAFHTSGLFEEYCQLVTTGQPLINEDLVYEDVFGGERIVKYYAVQASILNNDGFMVSWRDLTAQKQAERDLQAANQRTLDIWESMTDAYVTVDRDWRVIYANQAATQIIGDLTNLAPTEFIGRSHWDLFPSLVGGDVEREYRRALTDGVAVHLENWFEPTGSWFEVHLYPATEGLGIYFRDITDRKRMEAERLAAEQERDRFFNLSLDLLAIGNFEGYFTRINPAWEQTLGYTTAELLARPFVELIHPEDREITEVAIRRGLNEHWAGTDFENRYRCKDGSYRWLSWSTTPYPEQNLMYGIARDVTERKQMEMERIAAEQERDRFFNLSLDLLATIDFDGYFTRLNPAWEKTLGFTNADLMARPFIEFVHPDDRVASLAAAQNVSAGEVVVSFENRYLCQDGSYRWLLWSAIPYPEQNVMYGIAHDITERKQMETARIDAEQDRDRFFNLSIDLLAIGNAEGYFVRLNPAWEGILGFSIAELMAEPFINFVHPDDRAHTLAGAQSLANGEPLVNCENRYRCKDGSYRWVSWNATAHDLSQRWYAIGHDITDRKQAEAALWESEQKFSAIFDQSFELMGIVSLDGVLQEVNQTALDSIVTPKADIAGQYFWDTPWWHTEQLQQQLKDAISRAANGEFIRYEVQFPHPSGVTLTTDFSLKPVFDEAGRVWTIVAEAHDITDRKRAERELQESQERLKAGIEVAGVGLARFDYATNLVSLSPEAAALYGFAPDEIVVTRAQIHNTFHPDERAELEAIIAQVIDPAGTGWFARDHRVVWPNGEVRCLSVRKQVFFNRVGEMGCPSHAILAAIDITERKRNQSELEERNQELDSFVHIVSHDLKAPLRAIANLSQWIEDDLEGSLPAANQEQMEMLRMRVHRMEATIEGLLEYARIGRTDGEIEPVVVSELIAETIETLAPLPTFTIGIAQNLPTLYTNRMLLSQVFANLLGNAIKHHDRVDGLIHLGIAERNEFYEFAIADDGPGIDPVNHERVFRIFQAINPQNRSDSSGVGLAIVKKIVEAQGGNIRLESQPGNGTTFYFTWPKRF
jgi:PAS domain S-box-containing protein